MFWDIIYDFFVHHVFGGVDSLGNRFTSTIFAQPSARLLSNEVTMTFFNINNVTVVSYYCHIATLITLVSIILFCVFIIKKIIGIIFRLFTGSSAF